MANRTTSKGEKEHVIIRMGDAAYWQRLDEDANNTTRGATRHKGVEERPMSQRGVLCSGQREGHPGCGTWRDRPIPPQLDYGEERVKIKRWLLAAILSISSEDIGKRGSAGKHEGVRERARKRAI